MDDGRCCAAPPPLRHRGSRAARARARRNRHGRRAGAPVARRDARPACDRSVDAVRARRRRLGRPHRRRRRAACWFEDVPLVGIRHLVHDEADPEWLLRNDVQGGLSAVGEAGLVYDLLVRVRELPAAIETARRHSGMRFVLDHVAKRPLRLRPRSGRGNAASPSSPNTGMSRARSRVYSRRPSRRPRPRSRFALFGPERCMWGSDWPVTLLAAGYGDGLALVGDDPRVLDETAIATYGLQVRKPRRARTRARRARARRAAARLPRSRRPTARRRQPTHRGMTKRELHRCRGERERRTARTSSRARAAARGSRAARLRSRRSSLLRGRRC